VLVFWSVSVQFKGKTAVSARFLGQLVFDWFQGKTAFLIQFFFGGECCSFGSILDG